jgi:hypothetical protein
MHSNEEIRPQINTDKINNFFSYPCSSVFICGRFSSLALRTRVTLRGTTVDFPSAIAARGDVRFAVHV